MFDALIQRAAAAAKARAGVQRRRIAEHMWSELPHGVKVTEDADAVAVSGRALQARLVLDPGFRRWLEER